jgi:hypothetical protein
LPAMSPTAVVHSLASLRPTPKSTATAMTCSSTFVPQATALTYTVT